jgi:hypothetical protein
MVVTTNNGVVNAALVPLIVTDPLNTSTLEEGLVVPRPILPELLL